MDLRVVCAGSGVHRPPGCHPGDNTNDLLGVRAQTLALRSRGSRAPRSVSCFAVTAEGQREGWWSHGLAERVEECESAMLHEGLNRTPWELTGVGDSCVSTLQQSHG